DVNWQEYGGSWYARDTTSASKRVYHVVEFLNWESDTGQTDGHARGQCCFQDTRDDGTHKRPCPYVTLSGTFYLEDYTPEQLTSALGCCGWLDAQQSADIPRKGTLAYDLVCIEALKSYYGVGYFGDGSICCGTNARKLLQAAKRRM